MPPLVLGAFPDQVRQIPRTFYKHLALFGEGEKCHILWLLKIPSRTSVRIKRIVVLLCLTDLRSRNDGVYKSPPGVRSLNQPLEMWEQKMRHPVLVPGSGTANPALLWGGLLPQPPCRFKLESPPAKWGVCVVQNGFGWCCFSCLTVTLTQLLRRKWSHFITNEIS